MRKIQQFQIYKLDSNKILTNNCEIEMDFETAAKNNEVIALGDSQVLRVIRKLTGKANIMDKVTSLTLKKNRLKNIIKYNPENSDVANEFYDTVKKLNSLTFIPEYVSIVNENGASYNKIAKKGFYINGVKFVRFMCSASNARVNTAFFLAEDIIKQANDILKCGHSDDIEIEYAKYNAYFSLTSSATYEVSAPKVVVIDDKEVTGVHPVEWVDDNRRIVVKNVELEFNYFDGMGLISPKQAEKWGNELDVDYIPSAFCVRSPFVKGMVAVIDFHKFAYMFANNEQRMITDLWGNKTHIDDVDIVLTKSQFKLWKGYKSWQEYDDIRNSKGINWGVSKFTPKTEVETVRTNYQFVQVLDLDDSDVEELCQPTYEWLDGVLGGDINLMKCYLLGKATSKPSGIEAWNTIYDPTLKALLINDAVAQDKHISTKIMNSISKKITEAYTGKLIVDGNFQVRIKDPFALCEYLFGMEIKGILKNNQHYSKHWIDRDVDKVIGMRSPLTWESEAHEMNMVRNDMTDEWFKYLDSGLVYNVHGLDDFYEADADWDFDITCTTNNPMFLKGAQGGYPITYSKNKAEKKKIKYKELYKIDSKSFNSKIGFITNCSTALYEIQTQFEKNSPEWNEIENRLKMCRYYQGMAIDAAKGLVVEQIPKHWIKRQNPDNVETDEEKEQIIFNNKLVIDKRPYFMRHLYPKYNQEFKQYQQDYDNLSLFKFGYIMSEIPEEVKLTEEYLRFNASYTRYNPLLLTTGVMNRVCYKMEDMALKLRSYVKTKPNEELLNLYINPNFPLDDRKVCQMFQKYQEYCEYKSSMKNNDNSNLGYFCKQMKIDLFDICLDIREQANLAVHVCYVLNKSKAKDFAWDIAGDGIVENILEKNNGEKIFIPLKDKNGDITYLSEKYKMSGVDFDEFDF